MIPKLTAFVVATAVVALADISACDNIPGNLVKNCGFEIVVYNPTNGFNAFTDWTVSGNQYISTETDFLSFVHSGGEGAELAPDTGFTVSLGQTITDVAGGGTPRFLLSDSLSWYPQN